jgi:hypothetical protein
MSRYDAGVSGSMAKNQYKRHPSIDLMGEPACDTMMASAPCLAAVGEPVLQHALS